VIATETFMGFDASEWTAIGTVALTLVTIVYVVITRNMAKSAAASAASAAEAANRLARIAEAALDVDFSAKYDRESSALGNRWIVLECVGSKVFLHGVELYLAVYFVPGDDTLKFATGTLEVDDPEHLPALLHRGEWAHLRWSHGEVDPERHASGQLTVEYSLDTEGPTKRIRRVIDFGASEDKTLSVV
jgi:hypothetical protein